SFPRSYGSTSSSETPPGDCPMALCDVNELREFMAANFLFTDDYVLGDADSFLHTGILDSMGVLQIIFFLEERYQITLRDDEHVHDNRNTIQRLKIVIVRKLNGTCG